MARGQWAELARGFAALGRLIARRSTSIWRRFRVRRSTAVDPRHELGIEGEDRTIEFLREKKYKIIERNYSTDEGELDVIARDDQTIVFVEVKTRRAQIDHDPLEAVDQEKQKRIVRIAQSFLRSRGWYRRPYRFDVITIVWPENGEPIIRHYIQAFR